MARCSSVSRITTLFLINPRNIESAKSASQSWEPATTAASDLRP